MSPAGRPARAGADLRFEGWGWHHAGRATAALRGIDLHVEPGERVLLLGASGAGKSTVLAAAAGVLGGPDEGRETGRVLVDGQPPALHGGAGGTGGESRARAGLVLQDPQSNVILSRIGDDVAFGCENLAMPPERIWPRVRESLAQVGLNHPLDRATTHLSGGEQQRLALAGILALRTGLILLDEPTANLDPSGVIEVRDAVAALAETTGATLLVVEHRVDTWLPVVDRAVVLGPDSSGGVAAGSTVPATVIADAPPEQVVATQRERLHGYGIWLGGGAEVPRAPGTPGTELLVTEDLAVGREGTAVHRGLDLGLAEGTSTVVTGPNGSGKSTLALTLSGLLPPVGGRVRALPALAGSLGQDPRRWRSRDLVTRMGMVFQQPEHQFVAATVRAELELGPRVTRLPARQLRSRCEELLERLRLAPLAAANPHTLSGGEKRRLSVATALATAPRMLVLDEPTFGQDRTTWIELVTLMSELVDQGSALLAVTHDPGVVRVLGDTHVDLGPPRAVEARR